MQAFALREATSFHRFIRLDFPSYYGSEYYCPVSQVKVFGMNQMEAFKWEQKRSVQLQKDREQDRTVAKETEIDRHRVVEAAEKARLSEHRNQEIAARERELGELEKLVHHQALRADIFDPLPALSTTSTLSSNVVKASESSGSVQLSTTSAQSTNNGSRPDWNTTELQTKGLTRSDSSESIYASINRRLNALEGNSSLIARYLEEQSRVTRSALAALERDWDEWRLAHDADASSRWEQEVRRELPFS